MRPRPPSGPPPEMPALLRVFDPDEWRDDCDRPPNLEGQARGRWIVARCDWLLERGLSPLDELRERRRLRCV